jgi:hypothetical protein
VERAVKIRTPASAVDVMRLDGTDSGGEIETDTGDP